MLLGKLTLNEFLTVGISDANSGFTEALGWNEETPTKPPSYGISASCTSFIAHLY
jgi:hypothetical protein